MAPASSGEQRCWRAACARMMAAAASSAVFGRAARDDDLDDHADPGELEQERDGHGHGQLREREVVQHAGGARGQAESQQAQHAARGGAREACPQAPAPPAPRRTGACRTAAGSPRPASIGSRPRARTSPWYYDAIAGAAREHEGRVFQDVLLHGRHSSAFPAWCTVTIAPCLTEPSRPKTPPRPGRRRGLRPRPCGRRGRARGAGALALPTPSRACAARSRTAAACSACGRRRSPRGSRTAGSSSATGAGSCPRRSARCSCGALSARLRRGTRHRTAHWQMREPPRPGGGSRRPPWRRRRGRSTSWRASCARGFTGSWTRARRTGRA